MALDSTGFQAYYSLYLYKTEEAVESELYYTDLELGIVGGQTSWESLSSLLSSLVYLPLSCLCRLSLFLIFSCYPSVTSLLPLLKQLASRAALCKVSRECLQDASMYYGKISRDSGISLCLSLSFSHYMCVSVFVSMINAPLKCIFVSLSFGFIGKQEIDAC